MGETSRFEAAKRGESWAEKEILDLIHRFARHACTKVGTRLAVDLHWEDVAQEASVKFFKAGIHQYGGSGSEESYLYTVVKSTLIQIARSADRRVKREEAQAPSAEDRVVIPDTHLALDVQTILAKLDEACRDLLRRVFLEDTPYADLAAELALQEVSVRARVHRCVRRARELAS